MVITSELTHISANLSVRIEFHPLDDSVRRHMSQRYWRWLELFERDPAARISQHPDHVFADMSLAAGEPESIVLCEATRGEQLVALGVLVPKSMTWRQAGGFGLRKNLTGYRLAGNRFLGEANFDVQCGLLGACEDFCLQHGAMYLLIEDLEQTDPLLDAAHSIAHLDTKLVSLSGWQERWKIEFPPKPDDYWTKFSGKTRYNFRRNAKLLGKTRFVKVTEPSQVAEFLEAAHEISLRSWQTKQLGLRIHNNEAELTMLTFLASQQALRAYLLFVDDQPAAFSFGTQFRGHFIYEEVGYDHALSNRSPGQVLLTHILDDMLFQGTPRVFDFGNGDAEYKRLFATTQTTGGSIWLVPDSWRFKFWLTLLQSCRGVERFVRGMVKKLGWTSRLRQLIRGKRARVAPGMGTTTSMTSAMAGTDGAS